MMRGPTNGIKPMRVHQPLRFVSWSRRTHTPSDGSIVARANNPLNSPKLAFPFIPVIASTTRSAPTNKQLNNWKNQYSFRRARPENTAYCFKPSKYQCMIASLSFLSSEQLSQWGPFHEKIGALRMEPLWLYCFDYSDLSSIR